MAPSRVVASAAPDVVVVYEGGLEFQVEVVPCVQGQLVQVDLLYGVQGKVLDYVLDP